MECDMENAGRAGTGTRGFLNLGTSEGQLGTASVSLFIFLLAESLLSSPGVSNSVKRWEQGVGKGDWLHVQLGFCPSGWAVQHGACPGAHGS